MKRLSVVLLIFSLFACDRTEGDHENSGPAYFTLNVDQSSWTTPTGWIVIHRIDGSFLDSKAFKRGEVITFTSQNAPEEFIVTIAQSINDWDKQIITLESFTGIRKDEEWNFRKSDLVDLPGEDLGFFEMRIPKSQLLPGDSYPSVSDRYGYSASFWLSGEYAVLQKRITSLCDEVLVVIHDTDGHVRSRFFDNAAPGTFTYSVEDFTRLESVSKITFPATENVYLYMRGFEEGQSLRELGGYELSSYHNYNNLPISIASLELPRFEWIKTYRTNVIATYADKVLGYESTDSELPEAIDLADNFETSIANRNFREFSLQGEDYDWYKGIWTASTTQDNFPQQIEWIINAKNGTYPALEIPAAMLTEKESFLSDLQFEFKSVTLLRGRSLDEYIDYEYKEVDKAFQVYSKKMY